VVCGKQNSQYAPFVGQPILAAAGFQPALFDDSEALAGPGEAA